MRHVRGEDVTTEDVEQTTNYQLNAVEGFMNHIATHPEKTAIEHLITAVNTNNNLYSKHTFVYKIHRDAV